MTRVQDRMFFLMAFAVLLCSVVLTLASVLLAVTACFLPDAVEELWTGSLLWNLLQRSQNAPGWFDFWSHAFFRHWFWVRHGWVIPVFWSLFAIGLSRVIVARDRGWACWAVWAVLESVAVMNKLGLLSGQRFPGMIFWWKLSSADFREEIANDFLQSLNAEGEWLICERPIGMLRCRLKNERIAEALSRYRLECRAPGNEVYLYRRAR